MILRNCFKCYKDKPLTEFYAHPEMKGGRFNKCRECFIADVKFNRSKNRDHYLAYDKARSQTEERKTQRVARREK